MTFHTPTPLEIKAARERAKLSVAQAAKLVEFSRGAWHYWESGQRPMRPTTWRFFLGILENMQKNAEINKITVDRVNNS
jgi:DNA-binding transcriptional regulator YiaG